MVAVTQHSCCGYFDVNDGEPFGTVYDANNNSVNCAQTNPTWPPCVSALQTQFYSTRNANGNASAVNDEWVMHLMPRAARHDRSR